MRCLRLVDLLCIPRAIVKHAHGGDNTEMMEVCKLGKTRPSGAIDSLFRYFLAPCRPTPHPISLSFASISYSLPPPFGQLHWLWLAELNRRVEFAR